MWSTVCTDRRLPAQIDWKMARCKLEPSRDGYELDAFVLIATILIAIVGGVLSWNGWAQLRHNEHMVFRRRLGRCGDRDIIIQLISTRFCDQSYLTSWYAAYHDLGVPVSVPFCEKGIAQTTV